ncbi:triphosphoribosyl-dephospho-CoA synthase [Enterobacteriaceae bacterium Kacie_13]|nr:triphosphoribosyl-dephospho-CoA synthase [Enterobacteriaceae bacterium Kacie_13]
MPQTLTIGAVLTAEELAGRLAHTATQALIDEARLSPKPGLVDSRSSGAHQDLNLDLMVRSARSLTPTFYALALHSWQRPADIALRQDIGRLGRAGEAQMMAETGGVNTHRGAIWAMGLLVCAVAMQPESLLPQDIAQRAAKIAALPDVFSPKKFSKGSHAVQRYQVHGAREEAQGGFPHIIDCALPQLHRSRSRGASESEAQVDALLAVMTRLSDTCVLSRGGLPALNAMHQGAQAVLDAGGLCTDAGRQQLRSLERRMLADNVSPGGAADLLAATLFLDRVSEPDMIRIN